MVFIASFANKLEGFGRVVFLHSAIALSKRNAAGPTNREGYTTVDDINVNYSRQ
jgi:hypothetical protein